ncbi:MAG: site-specific DNA-methyltransferase, partial [Myxococcota bacterium]|nr:site-specific DNA-methyltransferase [Myxococcota bacterium]
MGEQLDLLLRSVAPSEAQMERLRRDFPGAFVEGALDPRRLLELLGIADVDSSSAGFGLSWSGREEALEALRTPSRGALVPDELASVDFERAENLVLEGDNLEVLKLLLPAYEETVKMIFIDPPYNTGHDFLYNDDFHDGVGAYLAQTDQVDSDGVRVSSRVELDGRHHSRWLTMMYPRLVLARRMLREDGVLFVTIDDNEVHHLRMLMNEVFGEENFVAQIAWQKRYTRSNNTDNFTSVIDQVLLYQRSDAFQVNLLPHK